jgi:hypothetical protein
VLATISVTGITDLRYAHGFMSVRDQGDGDRQSFKYVHEGERGPDR